MTALRCAIAQNYSETFFEKLFHTTFGVFDREYDWARNLEHKYMEEKKYDITNVPIQLILHEIRVVSKCWRGM